jgi:hypothetical protein
MRFVFLVFLITPMAWAGNWNKETFSSPENFSGLGTLHKSLQFGYKDHGVAEVKKSDGFPVFSGETSVRFEVRDGDCGYGPKFSDCDSPNGGGERHELNANNWTPYRGENEYGWNIFIPEEASWAEKTLTVMGQFKSLDGDNPFFFYFYNGSFGISKYRHCDGRSFNLDFNPIASMKNKWTTIKVNANWTEKLNGYFDVRIDGKLRFTYDGPTLQPESHQGVQLKFGIYRTQVGLEGKPIGTSIAFYDNVYQKKHVGRPPSNGESGISPTKCAPFQSSHNSQPQSDPLPANYVSYLAPIDHAFKVVTNPVRYGLKAERFELRDEDCYDEKCFSYGAYGNEIGIESTAVRARFDEEIWYGWSFYNENISAEYNKNRSLYLTFNRWLLGGKTVIKLHQLALPKTFEKCTSICSEALNKNTSSDVFLQLEDMQKNGSYNDKSSNWGDICRLFSLQENRNKWVDVVLRTNFGTNKNGFLDIWINGTKRCEYRGQIVATKNVPDAHGPNHRRGLRVSSPRRWNKNFPYEKKPTFVGFFDEFRVGQSREEVDIRMIEAAGGTAVD